MGEKGDFTGFTFAGVHSSDFNIIRTSDGDRFDEQLSPEINDITAEVPGMDGTYYYGSTFGTRTFDIKIAFDSMTEEQLMRLKKHFGRKSIGELVFDEAPYKKYLVKLESPIELSYVCFDESWKEKYSVYYGATEENWPDGVRVVDRIETEGGIESVFEKIDPWIYDYDKTQRIYKGDGNISFIAYFPFAKSVFKHLPIGEEQASWALGSRILPANDYAAYDTYSNGEIKIYNAGDVPTGFRLYCPGALANTMTLSYSADRSADTFSANLKIKPLALKTNDIGILIDTNSALIVGVSSFNEDVSGNAIYTTSGNLYNEYVDSGYFFQLQPNLKNDGARIDFTNGKNGMKIFYDYLYF